MNERLDRPCRRCGRRNWVKPRTRFDRETCSDACRKAISAKGGRGGDLEYLKAMTADQARIRRFLHETIRDEIALEKSIRAQRREYRVRARRMRLQAPRSPLRSIGPLDRTPDQYAPASFFVKVEKDGG